MAALRIVYDGECPFCSRYAAYQRLREEYIVELVDARAEPELAGNYGLDLNEGMIVDLDGQVHHGADAVRLLAQLSQRPGLLRHERVARALYPLLRFGRNVTLKILGRKPI
jgi:predicted DCC family thiol-disulfide oxidoreductase YuxK